MKVVAVLLGVCLLLGAAWAQQEKESAPVEPVQVEDRKAGHESDLEAQESRLLVHHVAPDTQLVEVAQAQLAKPDTSFHVTTQGAKSSLVVVQEGVQSQQQIKQSQGATQEAQLSTVVAGADTSFQLDSRGGVTTLQGAVPKDGLLDAHHQLTETFEQAADQAKMTNTADQQAKTTYSVDQHTKMIDTADQQQSDLASTPYQWAYEVAASSTGDQKSQVETRQPDGVVRGRYSVVEPDGSLRIVSYVAHPDQGFQATVQKQENFQKPIQTPQTTVNNQATLKTIQVPDQATLMQLDMQRQQQLDMLHQQQQYKQSTPQNTLMQHITNNQQQLNTHLYQQQQQLDSQQASIMQQEQLMQQQQQEKLLNDQLSRDFWTQQQPYIIQRQLTNMKNRKQQYLAQQRQQQQFSIEQQQYESEPRQQQYIIQRQDNTEQFQPQQQTLTGDQQHIMLAEEQHMLQYLPKHQYSTVQHQYITPETELLLETPRQAQQLHKSSITSLEAQLQPINTAATLTRSGQLQREVIPVTLRQLKNIN